MQALSSTVSILSNTDFSIAPAQDNGMQAEENHVTSKQRQWRIPYLIEKPIDLCETFFDIPLILVRFALGLKQIPWKDDSNMPIICNFRTKVW